MIVPHFAKVVEAPTIATVRGAKKGVSSDLLSLISAPLICEKSQ